MKKLTALLLAAVLMLALAACGKSGSDKDPIIGTWKSVSAEYNGYTIEVTDVTNEVKEDGSFIYSNSGDISEGTWKNENGEYTFTANNTPVKARIEGGQLIMTDGGYLLRFEK